jgi:hypothetical protein
MSLLARETDIRWSPDEHEVTRILLTPNQPPMYVLDSNLDKRGIYKR